MPKIMTFTSDTRLPRVELLWSDSRMILLRDVGPWDTYPTVTNTAEHLIDEFGPQLQGRRLFYYDSLGDLSEIVLHEGNFRGFRSVRLPFSFDQAQQEVRHADQAC